MFSKALFLTAAAAFAPIFVAADSAGYMLPTSGTASSTQFLIGPEFVGGTSCGLSALPGGNKLPGKSLGSGGGPGILYAAINGLAFGANSAVSGAGGAGGACGVCFEITPVAANGQALTKNALTFMIVDECPTQGGSNPNCGQCSLGKTNVFGQNWHFDVAVDAMSEAQYNQFYAGVDDGTDWKEVQFKQTGCEVATNPIPETYSWGCVHGCKNNDKASVCQT